MSFQKRFSKIGTKQFQSNCGSDFINKQDIAERENFEFHF